MNPADPRILAALAELREEYARELPLLFVTLAAAVSTLRAHPDTVTDAKGMAHRLRGTAGSYGFLAVSEAAAQLETALVSPLNWGEVEPAIEAVRVAIPAAEG